MTLPSIPRTRLSDQAAELLRDAILHGRLAPGSRVVETRASSELGVSRTPLREALIRLEQEGWLLAGSGGGYHVAPLDEAEVRDLYPILGSLEALLVSSLPRPDDRTVGHLRDLAQRMVAAVDHPRRLIELDAAWHDTFLAPAPNATARAMAASLRHRVQRYEFAFMRAGHARESARQHDAVLDAVLAGDCTAAAHALRPHWTDSVEPILREIRNENPE